MKRRPSIPKGIVADLLLLCRRRCCVCYFLDGNTAPTTQGQIAHLDRNRTNNTQGNLVYLCLRHHDLYDSRPSQSKALTPEEIKKYRDKLQDEFLTESRSLNLPAWRALDLLGGREAVCRKILDAVNVARCAARLTHDDLSQMLGLVGAGALRSLEHEPSSLTTDIALSLLTNLSIEIGRVLPLPALSHSDIQRWRLYMRNFSIQTIFAGGDPIDLVGDTALVIFLQLQAIKELDDPEFNPVMKGKCQ